MSEQADAPGHLAPATIERLRKMYEDTPLPVREISRQMRVTYGTLLILARARNWKKRGLRCSAPHISAPLPGWKRALATPAKKPRKAITFDIPEARTYDAATLSMITFLQRKGEVVFQCEPGLFMVGTRRMDMAGMAAKARRYGFGATR